MVFRFLPTAYGIINQGRWGAEIAINSSVNIALLCLAHTKEATKLMGPCCTWSNGCQMKEDSCICMPTNTRNKSKKRNQSGSEGLQLCIYSETEQTAHDTAGQRNKKPKKPLFIQVIYISKSSLLVEWHKSYSEVQTFRNYFKKVEIFALWTNNDYR